MTPSTSANGIPLAQPLAKARKHAMSTVRRVGRRGITFLSLVRRSSAQRARGRSGQSRRSPSRAALLSIGSVIRDRPAARARAQFLVRNKVNGVLHEADSAIAHHEVHAALVIAAEVHLPCFAGAA